MSAMRGRCTNFGGCSKAEQTQPIELAAGAEFKCPECGLSLSPIATGGLSSRARLLLAAAAGVALLAVAGAGLAYLLSGDDLDVQMAGVIDPSLVDDYVYVVPADDGLPTDPGTIAPDPVASPAPDPSPAPAPPPVARALTPPPAQAAPPAPVAAQPAPVPVEPLPVAPPEPEPAGVAPPSPPPVPQASMVSIPRRATLAATPISEICENSSRVEDTVAMRLSAPLELSDGSSLPAGTALTGRITGRQSTGNQPPLIEIEAERISIDGRTIDVETNPFAFHMTRPSAAGRVVRGAIIGSAAGAAVGLVLRRNVAATAAAGAGAGAAVGAAAGGPEACVSAEDTTFVFTVTRDVAVR